MTHDDYQRLLILLEQANSKIDNIAHQVAAIQVVVNSTSFAANREVQQLEDVKSNLRAISSDLQGGQVRSISYRMDNIVKSIDKMTQKVVWD